MMERRGMQSRQRPISTSPSSSFPALADQTADVAFRSATRWRRLALSLAFAILVFSSTILFLATPRIFPRVQAIFGRLTYQPLPKPHGVAPTPIIGTTTSRTVLATATAAAFLSYWPLLSHEPSAKMHKYANPPQAPPLFTGTKDSILGDTKAIIEETKALLDKQVTEIKPDDATFDTVLGPQLELENKHALVDRIIGFYQHVSSDPTLREASSQAEKRMNDFGIEQASREDLFRLVEAVYKKSGLQESRDADKNRVIDLPLAKKAGLEDVEAARLLEREYRGYIKMGHGLPPGKDKEEFKEIKKRLSDIAITFQKTLNEATGGLWLTVEELAGIPEDVLGGLQKGSGENEGKYKLTYKYPDLFPALKYVKDPEVRKKIYIGNENKCNSNVPLFKEAILLRDRSARLLGYPDHATLRIEDKMARTTETVLAFLNDLKSRLSGGGKKEREHLLEIKKKDCEARNAPLDGNYYLWDHSFYNRLMVEQEYSIDENKIAEYFPLTQTVAGMLKIFEQILGFVFVELGPEDRQSISPTGKGEDIAWHEDVLIFSVWDDEREGGGFVGYLYLDMHPRDGKYGHAANFNLQPGFIKTDGKGRRYPATALVCNFSKPTPKKPSLLKHSEVVTLFHELGHGIHDLAGRTRLARFHGTSVVRDFVEAPSQMLENWCWTPSVLKSLTGHYETGEKISDELLKKLVSTKHVNGALHNLRQLHFGLFDMTVHTAKQPQELEKMDMSKVYNDLRAEICGLQGPEAQGEPSTWGNGQATFGHLIGGYDAGYYGYLFSQVYSTDMFYSQFAEDPMDPDRGRRYRYIVLEKGGSRDEMISLEEFLGRKPSTEAFYKELGLSDPSKL